MKEKARHIKEKKPKKLWQRILIWSGIGLGGILGVVIIGFLTVFYTPFFPQARDQYILMTYHTSNPWLATLFFSDETIERVLDENRVDSPEGETNTGLIQIPGKTTETTSQGTAVTEPPSPAPTTPPTFPVSDLYDTEVIFEEDGVNITKINGDNYVARLIRVSDPSRVFLGVTSKLMKYGEKLVKICNDNDALVGVNAGGFEDPNGKGNGGTPSKLLVKDYEILYCDGQEKHSVIGFNEDNILILGEFTDEEIIEKRIRDAVAFGPFLIINGEKAKVKGMAGGYDPRTAIGQTADGTVLLLVIDGRQPGMAGGNMKTVMDIMWEYGAVNAANLDGGSSSTVVLNGEIINKPCSLYGPRYLPDGWLVKKAS